LNAFNSIKSTLRR